MNSGNNVQVQSDFEWEETLITFYNGRVYFSTCNAAMTTIMI